MHHLPLSLMNLSLTSLLSLAGAIIAYLICVVIALKARAESRRASALARELEEKLSTISREVEQLSQIILEQTDRIAQLEARPPVAELEPETDFISSLTTSAKPSITERRHRVLSLARRGLDAETIATTLGAPHGEVELIIELNNATLGAAR